MMTQLKSVTVHTLVGIGLPSPRTHEYVYQQLRWTSPTGDDKSLRKAMPVD
ncbi:MAG: hypothetical protein ABSE08_21060 [Syntrophobacteraceae bacterium]